MWDREGSGLPKANGFAKHRSCEDKLGKCALPELVKTWEWGWSMGMQVRMKKYMGLYGPRILNPEL